MINKEQITTYKPTSANIITLTKVYKDIPLL